MIMNQSQKQLYQRLEAFSLDEPNPEYPLLLAIGSINF